MPANRYYSMEKMRHSRVFSTPCTQVQASAALDALARLYSLAPIEVRFHIKSKPGHRAASWYQARYLKLGKGPARWVDEHFNFEVGMLNYLTLAHEFAHRIHRLQYDHRRALAIIDRRRPVAELWHGAEHRAVVNEVVVALQEMGFVPAVRPGNNKVSPESVKKSTRSLDV